MLKAIKKFLSKLTAPKPLSELSPRVLIIDDPIFHVLQ
jgi:hypothetical protein